MKGIGFMDMQNMINKLKGMDKEILILVDIGQMIFFLVSLLGVAILFVHYKLYISAELYEIGVEVFKIGVIGAISVVVCSCGLWIVKGEMK